MVLRRGIIGTPEGVPQPGADTPLANPESAWNQGYCDERSAPALGYHRADWSDLNCSHLVARPKIRKALFEELILHVDKDEMARLLDLEPGFTVQQIEAEGEAFRLIFSRTTDLTEQHPRREDRRKGLFD